jgi:predicted metal-dependent hydrolase
MQKCDEPPSGRLLLAIQQFNRRDWYECHEVVEDLWIGAVGETRDFFQGIIQIAIALHHWRNGNFGGAVSLLKGGAGYLGRVSDACQWVDVAALITDSDKMRDALEMLGNERMALLPPSLVPLIKTVTETDS